MKKLNKLALLTVFVALLSTSVNASISDFNSISRYHSSVTIYLNALDSRGLELGNGSFSQLDKIEEYIIKGEYDKALVMCQAISKRIEGIRKANFKRKNERNRRAIGRLSYYAKRNLDAMISRIESM